jgi:hypothetical protein
MTSKPASRARTVIPVIEIWHEIVNGVTPLMLPDQVRYGSKVFKVEQARITHIDIIGLVKAGLDHTTGFGTRTSAGERIT